MLLRILEILISFEESSQLVLPMQDVVFWATPWKSGHDGLKKSL